jgi:hypothetical protein
VVEGATFDVLQKAKVNVTVSTSMLGDSTFILNKIDLIIYDRQGNYIDNNGYEFTFSLGIET